MCVLPERPSRPAAAPSVFPNRHRRVSGACKCHVKIREATESPTSASTINLVVQCTWVPARAKSLSFTRLRLGRSSLVQALAQAQPRCCQQSALSANHT
eukprot:366505-Chlamydomonas_euryale.AAC.8